MPPNGRSFWPLTRLMIMLLAASIATTGFRAVAQEPVPDPAQTTTVPADADAAASAPTDTPALAATPDRPLPQDLTVTAMFLHANPIVRGVMIALVTASVLTWTILLAKGIEIGLAIRRLRRALPEIETGETLPALHLRLAARRDPLAAMVGAAVIEFRQSGDAPRAGTKERVSSRLQRIEMACSRRMSRATGVLATIGSTAPFVGLFGTVWGIMDSFIGISRAHTTNLAVVAPGIAEALLATAAGLIAAIPAVVIYNAFARSIGGYRAMLGDLAAGVERLASRDLDVGRRLPNAAAE